MTEIRKNQVYKNKKYNSTSNSPPIAVLGTVEADASENYGKFSKKQFRGYDAIKKVSQLNWDSCLDIGSGKCLQSDYLEKKTKRKVHTCDLLKVGENCNSNIHDYDYVGYFEDIDFNGKKFDLTYSIHVLEHVLNVNSFLKKLINVTKENGYICIVVPIRKPFIVSGHMTIWNAGLVLYNLVVAGVDCSAETRILQSDYDICVIVKNKKRDTLKDELLFRDSGDLKSLAKFFPETLQQNIIDNDCFDGDIFKLNWSD